MINVEPQVAGISTRACRVSVSHAKGKVKGTIDVGEFFIAIDVAFHRCGGILESCQKVHSVVFSFWIRFFGLKTNVS